MHVKETVSTEDGLCQCILCLRSGVLCRSVTGEDGEGKVCEGCLSTDDLWRRPFQRVTRAMKAMAYERASAASTRYQWLAILETKRSGRLEPSHEERIDLIRLQGRPGVPSGPSGERPASSAPDDGTRVLEELGFPSRLL